MRMVSLDMWPLHGDCRCDKDTQGLRQFWVSDHSWWVQEGFECFLELQRVPAQNFVYRAKQLAGA